MHNTQNLAHCSKGAQKASILSHTTSNIAHDNNNKQTMQRIIISVWTYMSEMRGYKHFGSRVRQRSKNQLNSTSIYRRSCKTRRRRRRRRLCGRCGSTPSRQRGWSPLPNFRPMSIVAKRLHGSRYHLVRR